MDEINWINKIRDEILKLEMAENFYFGGTKLILMGAREYKAFVEFMILTDYPWQSDVTKPKRFQGHHVIRVAARSFFEVVPFEETQMYGNYLDVQTSPLHDLADAYLDRKEEK